MFYPHINEQLYHCSSLSGIVGVVISIVAYIWGLESGLITLYRMKLPVRIYKLNSDDREMQPPNPFLLLCLCVRAADPTSQIYRRKLVTNVMLISKALLMTWWSGLSALDVVQAMSFLVELYVVGARVLHWKFVCLIFLMFGCLYLLIGCVIRGNHEPGGWTWSTYRWASGFCCVPVRQSQDTR